MRTKGSRRHSALARYVVTPLVGALLGALVVTTIWLFFRLTGYRGKRRLWEDPQPLAEAWPDPSFVVMVFVVTLLVLVGRALIRRWRSTDRVGL